MKILVSACLLGVCCRYDGKSKPCQAVLDLAKKHELIPVCPEQLGGLSTPRPPAEIQGEYVRKQDGGDVTAQYQKGALEAARLYELLGNLTAGNGVTAGLFLKKNIPVFTEETADQIG